MTSLNLEIGNIGGRDDSDPRSFQLGIAYTIGLNSNNRGYEMRYNLLGACELGTSSCGSHADA
jgi:hypothetical protein